jgi:predicted lipid-binding transport protein (Tim44 family)
LNPNNKIVNFGPTVQSGIHLRAEHIAAALAVAGLAGLYYWWRFRRNAGNAARILSQNPDPIWNEESLKAGAAETFRKVKAAWSGGQSGRLNDLLEGPLFREWEMRKAEARMAGERESVSGITVQDVEILNAKDFLDDGKDEFIAAISFNATEALHRNGAQVRIENGVFVEFWKLGRHGKGWRVREISRDGVLARMSLALEPSFREAGKGKGNA